MPTTSAMPMVKISARPSSATLSRRGMPPGASAASAPSASRATSQPPSAPAPPNRIDSVIRSRTRSARVAPSAVRSAVSPARPEARASRRFATFTQALRAVHAGDAQQGAAAAEQEPQRPPQRLAANPLVRGPEGDALALVLLRVGGDQIARDAIHVLERDAHRHAILQTRHAVVFPA